MKNREDEERRIAVSDAVQSRRPRWIGKTIALAVVGVVAGTGYRAHTSSAASVATPPPPSVTVSTPLQRNIAARLEFLGQFSAVDRVELRAQVGGTLTKIRFKDGDVVRQGDVLFEIDPEPYEIRLADATAQLSTAKARFSLATKQSVRAEALQHAEAGTIENVDRTSSELRQAQAAIDGANAAIRDAKFDLNHCTIRAPFTGKMGTHLVSVGNLISGSRAGSSPTTLLATIVSLDPIYLNFDMSENDFATFERARKGNKGQLASVVHIAPTGDTSFDQQGTLNFLDNAIDPSSGTIHARATIQNGNFALTPGGFSRVRLDVSDPRTALLVPDIAVAADQTDHSVLVVDQNDIAVPRKVTVGGLRGGLRIITSGLNPDDKVIIDGIPTVHPGAKVSPHTGKIEVHPDQTDRSNAS